MARNSESFRIGAPSHTALTSFSLHLEYQSHEAIASPFPHVINHLETAIACNDPIFEGALNATRAPQENSTFGLGFTS